MATLGMHRDFLLEFAALEKSVQRRVFDAFEKFTAATHAGAHLEKLTHQRDPRLRTIRITDFWRGVVLKAESGDSYLLLKVLPHDKANDYATKHRASVNAATEGIEIRNDVALDEAVTALRQETADAPRSVLFAAHSDKVLRSLGIDEDLLPLIRLLPDATHLEAMERILPEQQYTVLVALAGGLTPEEVDREVVQAYARAAALRPAPAAADELTSAMARAQGRVALVSSTEELRDILERPFDAWRVFLHPSQYRLAYQDAFQGPARVSGGPGTGKTVVALHRAYELARRLPGDAPDDSVLLTTFTRDMAAELERSLDLLAHDPGIRAKIRVVNVDTLANEVLRRARGGAPLKLLVDQREILVRWSRIARRLGLDCTDVFLDQEWRQVILGQALRTPEEYLKASRAGRGVALGPLKRAQLWRAVNEFEQQLRQAGERTFLQVCAEAAELLDRAEGRPFRHVVVDEIQDLHPAQWRFLRALVAAGPDDLFLAGDPHQRIYGNNVSLRSLGVHVVGRSFRLRVNYRTTQEILAWSTGLLQGACPDDMDGGEDSLAGYRSTMHGPTPGLQGHPSKAQELMALVEQVVAWTSAGVEPDEIGVAVRFTQLARDVAQALERAGVAATVLGAGQARPGVRVATMHRMKGLEFRCMAVAGVSDGTVPARNLVTPREVDELQHQEDLASELNLLFVACTRAREVLRVSWHGNPSPFLDALRSGAQDGATTLVNSAS